MKKLISLFSFMAIMLTMSLTVFAGSIPEDLLYEDEAQIFFAEVVYYHPDKENPDIEFSPVKKIKGDVKIGTKQIAYQPNTVGDFDIKVGSVYLFTYFDENNPTDIFETTTQDTKTLKIKNTDGDMWKRFEEYLNEGSYEKAELRRLGRLEDYEKVKNAKVMSDLFILDRDNVEKIEVIYPGDGDPYGCYIDKDKFLDIAEKISLAPKNRVDTLDGGIWIVAVDKDDNRHGVWLDEDARLGCPQYETSSAVTTQYDIKKSDFIKLYAFLPEEATTHMELDNPMINHTLIAIGIVILVFVFAFIIGYKSKKEKQ